MIQPTRRAILVLLGGMGIALLPAIVSPSLASLWLLSLVVTLCAGLFEILRLPRTQAVQLRASAPDVLGIGREHALRIELKAMQRSALELSLDLHVDLPEHFDEQPTRSCRMSEGAAVESLAFIARRRGSFRLTSAWMRWSGPLGLFRRLVRVPLLVEVEVVPDLARVRAAAIRWFEHRDFSPGQRTQTMLGDGSEFEALREFRTGHDPRAIDWKASARLRRLHVRDFRAERNHQIIVGIDCGQLMREPVNGLPRLDHSIDAALLLAYGALKMGDRIGLFAFDEAMRCWAAPTSGMTTVTRLQKECASLAYAPVETNFTRSLTELSARLTRRSLIVLFTDFWDSITAELMVENLGRLRRRHLVIFVSLRDPKLHAVATGDLQTNLDLERAVVAQSLVREREEVFQKLSNLGIHVLDRPSETAAADLVSEYLRIHRRELL